MMNQIENNGRWWICLSCNYRYFGRADYSANSGRPLWKWCLKCGSSSKAEDDGGGK